MAAVEAIEAVEAMEAVALYDEGLQVCAVDLSLLSMELLWLCVLWLYLLWLHLQVFAVDAHRLGRVAQRVVRLTLAQGLAQPVVSSK